MSLKSVAVVKSSVRVQREKLSYDVVPAHGFSRPTEHFAYGMVTWNCLGLCREALIFISFCQSVLESVGP